MKKLLIFAMCAISTWTHAVSLVDYVNPLNGTASTPGFSHGNTYPAIARPWGMNFWSPQTGENRSGWMYTYSDTIIRGFRQTHQPSPWINDYGTFSILPLVNEAVIQDKKRGIPFSHADEKATPYYYRVKTANGITTEITPTERAAMFRISYPEKSTQYLVVDAYDRGSMLQLDNSGKRLKGYAKNNNGGTPANFANYFALEFNYPVVKSDIYIDYKKNSEKNDGNHVIAVLQFNIPAKGKLIVKTASSFISHSQAILNLKRELRNLQFDELCLESKATWNKAFGRIEVTDDNLENKRTFYSCLYRTLLFPRKFYEFDAANKPVHYSPYNGKVLPGYMYTDNGFWDTFRSVHPFFTLMYPEISRELMQSLVSVYDESGFLPEWMSPGHRNCMIGNNSVSIITDAWMKGIRDFDARKALQAMIKTTNAQGPEPSVGRNGFEAYNRMGYVPYPDFHEATAKTLEYAYADWCVSRFAGEMKDTATQHKYEKKALNYRNLFDKKWGFMRSKDKDGNWNEPFDPTEWGGPFTEGCSWHYTWSVMHDPEGLAQLMGGRKMMAKQLDSVFTATNDFKVGTYGYVIHEMAEMKALNMGQYAHGNQPIQHAIYLYNYAFEPWKAQYHLRNVMTKLYNSGPKAYCGDEDNGQTSAWYVFSAMGFYPVCPGQPEYIIGSPLFSVVRLNLPNGKTFLIDAANNSAQNVYIQAATLNGAGFTRGFIRHRELTAGGKLQFSMSASPNTTRGTREQDLPYSFSRRGK